MNNILNLESITIVYINEEENWWDTWEHESTLSFWHEASLGNSKVKIHFYDLTNNSRIDEETVSSKFDQNNVMYHCWDASDLALYNEALECCDEGWIHFVRSSTEYDVMSIWNMLTIARSEGQVAASLVPAQSYDTRHRKILKFRERNCVIDLTLGNRSHWNFILDSYFFRREAIDNLRFSSLFSDEVEEHFLLNFFRRHPSYYISDIDCMLKRFTYADEDNYEPAYNLDWYAPCIADSYLPMLENNPTDYVLQAGLLNLSERKIYANRNNSQKGVLSSEEIDQFIILFTKLLKLISDDVIVAPVHGQSSAIEHIVIMNWLRLKYQKAKFPYKIIDGGINILADDKEIKIENINKITFKVDAINESNGSITIEGELSNVYWACGDDVRFIAFCGEERIEAEYTGIYRFEKFFGRPVWRGHMVRIIVPESFYSTGKIIFHVEIGGYSIPCSKITFSKIQARLSTRYRHSYWLFGNYILRYGGKRMPDTLTIEKAHWIKKQYLEQRLRYEIRDPYLITLRKLCIKARKQMHGKRIWITYDQLYKGGDNGEYFYHYVTENHSDEVEMYYLANSKTVKESYTLRKQSKLLIADADGEKKLDMQLKALCAEKIFSTRAVVDGYFGLREPRIRAAVCDLFNAEIVCLQHGLTVQNIAEYQNRLFDNMKHYFCASPFERDNITKKVYGYTADMISITGLPRYDGLNGEPKKQILIAPTWRRNVTNGPKPKGTKYSYNDYFKRTAYYRIYNELINDERLIDVAKKNGFKVLFVLHPNVGSNAMDFMPNEVVNVVNGIDADYERLLADSALLVTDYSGIQFDFAYMRRPLIYYRPKELISQYDEGVSYEIMGFGATCINHQEIIDAICAAIEGGCILERNYRDKINKFFPYEDRENCKRVYEAAIK